MYCQGVSHHRRICIKWHPIPGVKHLTLPGTYRYLLLVESILVTVRHVFLVGPVCNDRMLNTYVNVGVSVIIKVCLLTFVH